MALDRIHSLSSATTLTTVPAAESGFTADQVALIKRTIAAGCSDDELALFLQVCRSSGLDPFRRQVYAIVRGKDDKRQMSIQTGIDGYRLLAARTGDLAGIDDPAYDSEDADHPNRASVTVWRWSHGQRIPFTATARWKEYAALYDGKASGKWRDMPYLMLGKCAEALALRRAFPAELSGVYTADEMAQADAITPDLSPTTYVESLPAEVAEVSNLTLADERIDQALRNRELLGLLTQLGRVEQRARRMHLAMIFQHFDQMGHTLKPGDLKAALEGQLAEAMATTSRDKREG